MVVKDLICGMQVDEQCPAGTSEYRGKTYYFCSLGCKAALEKVPEKPIDSHDEKADAYHHH